MKSFEEWIAEQEERENNYFLELEEQDKKARQDLLNFLNENNLAHYNKNNIKKYVEHIIDKPTQNDIKYYFNLL